MAKKPPRFRRGDAVTIAVGTVYPGLRGKRGGITKVIPRTNGHPRYNVRINGALYLLPEADLIPMLARREP